ncbi:ATP-binding protein [Geobacter anodireducens]|uniref:ATP-binding protein n=1 Tax=Geobacter soli TaxID=1510391 RepID=UPI000A69D0A1|nr:ATP-binding protein [Geobacter soli]
MTICSQRELLEIVENRYDRRATPILDRLVHNAHKVELRATPRERSSPPLARKPIL